jgi:hypothetical protein
MKFYGNVLALALLAPAAAFHVRAPKSSPGVLYSAPPSTGGDGPAIAKVRFERPHLMSCYHYF